MNAQLKQALTFVAAIFADQLLVGCATAPPPQGPVKIVTVPAPMPEENKPLPGRSSAVRGYSSQPANGSNNLPDPP